MAENGILNSSHTTQGSITTIVTPTQNQPRHQYGHLVITQRSPTGIGKNHTQTQNLSQITDITQLSRSMRLEISQKAMEDQVRESLKVVRKKRKHPTKMDISLALLM